MIEIPPTSLKKNVFGLPGVSMSNSNDIVAGGQHQMRERERNREKKAQKPKKNRPSTATQSKDSRFFFWQIAETPPRREFAEKQQNAIRKRMQSTLGLLGV